MNIKKKLPMKSLFSLIALWVLSTVVFGQDKALKIIEKGFKANNNVKLEIANKYGQVIINTWQRDSIKVKIKVEGYGKDKDASEKLLSRAEFEFNQIGDFIVIETVVDRSQGFFKDLWNEISDYSKSILGKSKLTIDYEVYMPVNGSVDIEQKYGDIYLDNIKGDIKISLSNGNLKIDEVSKDFILDLSFGRANIRTMRDGFFTLRSADVEVENANRLDLRSSSSTIIANEIKLLKIDSRNDNIRLDKISTLRGDGNFTTINIKSLSRTAFIDMNYGELNIIDVQNDFTDIQLKGKSTDFDIMLQEKSLADVSLVGAEEEMTLSYGKYIKSPNETDPKLITVKGTIGIGESKSGNIDIHADGGRVKLQYKTNQNSK